MKLFKWIHTIIFFAWMWLFLAFTLLLLIPLGLLRLLHLKRMASGYVYGISRFWAIQHMFTAGTRLKIIGRENIPSDGAFCVVGNHQGNMDIPILMKVIPRTLGFIAKAELRNVPFISTWMKAMGCVFIDRKQLRSSINALRESVEQVKNGRSMVLFPEGTRSRTGVPGRFNSAGIRMLVENQVPILPVTIINSRSLFEKHKLISVDEVQLIIHPVPDFAPDEAVDAVNLLRETIVKPLASRS